jgi:hypothetical protein
MNALNSTLSLDNSVTPPARSRSAKWTAGICAGLVVAFLGFDTILKVFMLGPAVKGTTELGFSHDSIIGIGLVELAMMALYLLPRTAPIGAVLWTGYLGGAVATHVRMGHPLLTHTLMPIWVAVLLWLPLYLKDSRVRALVGRRHDACN